MNPGTLEILGKNIYQIFGYALSAMTVAVGEERRDPDRSSRGCREGQRMRAELGL